MKLEKILFVDDEENLLSGIKRQLRKKYNIVTANSGANGLEILAKEGPFAVVVSDMRMPNMDGVTFLSQVDNIDSDTVKLMLTGNADQETAIKAVNDGKIFRFINKPCPPDQLENILNDALRQYHLIISEKELLEHTFKGAIKVLIDILSLTNPIAFSKAFRIRYFTSQISTRLGLKDKWQIDIAAMLSQIGYVTIPKNIMEKVVCGEHLSADEEKMLDDYPCVGANLIASIPRLKTVSMIIKKQSSTYAQEDTSKMENASLIEVGSQILKISIAYDSFLSKGCSQIEAINSLKNDKENSYYKKILDLLQQIPPPFFEKKIVTVNMRDLMNEMQIEEEIKTKKGVLLIRKGQQVTNTMRSLLRNYIKQDHLADSFIVSIPIHLINNQ